MAIYSANGSNHSALSATNFSYAGVLPFAKNAATAFSKIGRRFSYSNA